MGLPTSEKMKGVDSNQTTKQRKPAIGRKVYKLERGRREGVRLVRSKEAS